MNTRERVKTYFWLLNTIQRHDGITLSAINDLWIKMPMSRGVTIDRNTFRHYLDDIEEIFDLNIDYSPQNGYSISCSPHVSQHGGQSQLLANLSEVDFLMKFRSLGTRIQTEDIPRGNHYLNTIGTALRKHRLLRVTYSKFVDEEPYTALIEPYCLKAIRRRWYLLGKKQGDCHSKLFALDRIMELTLTSDRFVPDATINPSTHFTYVFGSYIGSGDPEKLILRTTELSAKYLRTLPLHHSQTEPTPCEFHYRLRITPDLINELMRYGTNIEVLAPETLREAIVKRIENLVKQYNVQ